MFWFGFFNSQVLQFLIYGIQCKIQYKTHDMTNPLGYPIRAFLFIVVLCQRTPCEMKQRIKDRFYIFPIVVNLRSSFLYYNYIFISKIRMSIRKSFVKKKYQKTDDIPLINFLIFVIYTDCFLRLINILRFIKNAD